MNRIDAGCHDRGICGRGGLFVSERGRAGGPAAPSHPAWSVEGLTGQQFLWSGAAGGEIRASLSGSQGRSGTEHLHPGGVVASWFQGNCPPLQAPTHRSRCSAPAGGGV